jgi:hypothetical protein
MMGDTSQFTQYKYLHSCVGLRISIFNRQLLTVTKIRDVMKRPHAQELGKIKLIIASTCHATITKYYLFRKLS